MDTDNKYDTSFIRSERGMTEDEARDRFDERQIVSRLEDRNLDRLISNFGSGSYYD